MVVGGAIVAGLCAWGRAVGPGDPLFAAVAGFTLLGLLDLARYFVRFRPLLGAPRSWEARGRVYRLLGVRAFGAGLRRPPLRWFNPRVYRGAAGDSRMLAAALEEAEGSHTLAFVAVTLYTGLAAWQGWWPAALALLALNVGANVYPILHLRHCRARLLLAAARRRR